MAGYLQYSRGIRGTPHLSDAMRTIFFVFFLTATLTCAADDMQEAMKAFHAGDLTGAKAALELIARNDPQNKTVPVYLRMIAAKQAGEIAARRRLDATILPKIDFRDVSAREAFEYAIQLINKNATDGKKTNIVWMVPSDFPARVTLALEQVPASVALTYIAESVGLAVAFEEHAIKVSVP